MVLEIVQTQILVADVLSIECVQISSSLLLCVVHLSMSVNGGYFAVPPTFFLGEQMVRTFEYEYLHPHP